VTPSVPLFGFPVDWVDNSSTLGNSTRATLNFGTSTLTGTPSGGVVVFDPSDPMGDDQKLLNIFYFCNYMHNFLFILGFDEPSGNFQMRNATLTGLAADPVRARAHSGPVVGTANMATGPDGLPPLMNMGLVVRSGRHTAFDADVVFHEYVHGLTNRLAGGPLDTGSMSLLQPKGLGEGASDYFALTLLNFFRQGPEKVVLGDWVVDSPGGIRRAPYDENYPFKYGDMSAFPQEHAMGEVWCAALMSMTRRVRAALGNQEGYRISWQIVVDGLKLISGNPTYLEARDGILRALDDLRSINRITAPAHAVVRKAAWQAFARFGMGVNAFSPDPDDVDNISGDETLPADLTT
jgi:extracellular elastinolytic metalloproteinase